MRVPLLPAPEGDDDPESPSTPSSTSLVGHPSSESHSDGDIFFSPKSSPDSENETLIAEEDFIPDEQERAEWERRIFNTFNTYLNTFDKRGVYAPRGAFRVFESEFALCHTRLVVDQSV